MKQAAVVLVLVTGLIGGATWYGLNRVQATAASRPETSQKLVLAQKFAENGDHAKALEVLQKLEADGIALGEEGDFTRLSALAASSDAKATATAAAAFVKKYPQSTRLKEAEAIRLTSGLDSGGDVLADAEAFVKANPAHNAVAKLQMALAKKEIAAGNHDAALSRLEAVMASNLDNVEVVRAAAPIGDANMERLFSTELQDGDTEHVLARGETVNGIARKAGVTEQLLLRCNGIDNPKSLRIGQKLKVPNVNFSLRVDVAQNTMALLNHGKLFKLYLVRTGREKGATPAGEFKILNKKSAPTWRPGDGRVYLPGDPNNELGTRWMSFQGDILGVHGTLHPETLGNYASNGCVGLAKEDVEELFDLLTVGTPITIIGEQDLTRHKVIPAHDVPPPVGKS